MLDPSIGRWLEEDPEGFDAGDANLFRYVGNDPTNETDPTGEVSSGLGAVAGAGALGERSIPFAINWATLTPVHFPSLKPLTKPETIAVDGKIKGTYYTAQLMVPNRTPPLTIVLVKGDPGRDPQEQFACHGLTFAGIITAPSPELVQEQLKRMKGTMTPQEYARKVMNLPDAAQGRWSLEGSYVYPVLRTYYTQVKNPADVRKGDVAAFGEIRQNKNYSPHTCLIDTPVLKKGANGPKLDAERTLVLTKSNFAGKVEKMTLMDVTKLTRALAGQDATVGYFRLKPGVAPLK